MKLYVQILDLDAEFCKEIDKILTSTDSYSHRNKLEKEFNIKCILKTTMGQLFLMVGKLENLLYQYVCQGGRYEINVNSCILYENIVDKKQYIPNLCILSIYTTDTNNVMNCILSESFNIIDPYCGQIAIKVSNHIR